MGRPSRFTQKLADEICRRIADGESLRAICEDPGMPHRETVRVWLCRKADFSAQYARAREDQADHYAEEIISLADESMSATSKEQAQAYRLRVDARKWAAAKLKPASYGDKQQVELSGEVAIRQMDDAELDNRLVALMAALDATLHR